MSTNEITVDTVTDDLDVFSSQLFGQTKGLQEPASSETDDTDVGDGDAPEEDTHSTPIKGSEEDTLANEDDDSDDEGDDTPEEDAPKPKKSRAQERIEELNAKYREEQRKRELLEERLAKLEQNGKTDTPAPKAEVVDTGPAPDDKNEDGTDKYPLGEFDPGYIRDLTKHTLQEEQKAFAARLEQEKAELARDAERAALQSAWQEKLVPAQERYPDFHEKGEQLLDTFSEIDAAYGEYLSSTIMSMDYGPDVLYYLASHPDEAQTIVKAGPALATIALGRLEAKFAFAEEEKQKARPKVSKAPVPPVHTNKGSAVAHIETPDDTDDLDAFAEKLFKKRRS